jgi:hypothetical protein
MFRYTAKIRLGNSVTNEIRKENISAAEIMILQRLHGGDAVLDIKEGKNDNSPYLDERENLYRRYSRALSRLEPSITFDQMFGPAHIELPSRLPSLDRKAREAAGEEKPGAKNRVKPKVDTKESEVDISNIAE